MKTKAILVQLVTVFGFTVSAAYAGGPTRPCLIKVTNGESIQSAVTEASQDGCTIWVGEGIYDEDIFIDAAAANLKNLTLIGAGIGKTVIRGHVNVLDRNEERGFGIPPSGRSITTIKHLTLDGNGIAPQSGLINDSAYVRLESVRITKFSVFGVLISAFSRVDMDHCVIDHNTFGLADNSVGGTWIQLLNNTFADNAFAIVLNVQHQFDSYANIINNIIAGSQTGIYVENSFFTPFVEFNDFFGNQVDIDSGGAVQGDQSTNLDADPMFRSPATGDYHIRYNSPCINAGDPLSPRDPNGSIADIGALPFAGISPVMLKAD